MNYTDKFGRAKPRGTRRVAGRETARARGAGNKPLPLHLAVHPQRAKPTRVNNGRVHRSFPQLEALTMRTLERRLESGRPRQAPYMISHIRRGYLGWTGDYGLALTLCRRGDGDIFMTRGR